MYTCATESFLTDHHRTRFSSSKQRENPSSSTVLNLMGCSPISLKNKYQSWG